jgi:hypothetical protein
MLGQGAVDRLGDLPGVTEQGLMHDESLHHVSTFCDVRSHQSLDSAEGRTEHDVLKGDAPALSYLLSGFHPADCQQ